MLIAFAVTTFTTTVLSLTGNILVVLAIVKRRRLHTISNVYICALAGVDMFISTLHSLKYTLVLTGITLGNFWCCVLLTLSLFGVIANLMIIEAISVDRFVAIYWPFRYRTICTKSRAVKISLFLVLISLISVAGSMAIFLPRRDTDAAYFMEDLFNIPIAVGMTLLTCCVTLQLFIMYGAMLYKAITHHKNIHIRNSGKDTSVFDIKALKTCSVVLGAFLIMWFPPLIAMNVSAQSQNPKHHRFTLVVCLMLPAVNSMVDPLVYSIMRKDIQKGIRRLFRKPKRKYVCN